MPEYSPRCGALFTPLTGFCSYLNPTQFVQVDEPFGEQREAQGATICNAPRPVTWPNTTSRTITAGTWTPPDLISFPAASSGTISMA